MTVPIGSSDDSFSYRTLLSLYNEFTQAFNKGTFTLEGSIGILDQAQTQAMEQVSVSTTEMAGKQDQIQTIQMALSFVSSIAMTAFVGGMGFGYCKSSSAFMQALEPICKVVSSLGMITGGGLSVANGVFTKSIGDLQGDITETNGLISAVGEQSGSYATKQLVASEDQIQALNGAMQTVITAMDREYQRYTN